jgi:hypothetical protein
VIAVGDAYTPHRLHARDRTYAASGCYIDLVIELLHWRGLDPLAMLGSLVRLEWEGGGFTYLKPRFEDLDILYGVDVHELLLYKPLPEHIAEQFAHGHFVLFEADTFYLPDMAGIAYHAEHAKGAVLATSIDLAAERMRYFHGTGHHEVDGEDYRGVFHALPHFTDDVVDHYAELVVFRRCPGATDSERLRGLAGELLVRHAARRPEQNPFLAWGESLGADLERLAALEREPTQGYAFVSARMAGSTSELLADHLEWLLGPAGAAPATPLRRISEGCRTMTFRLSRRRPFDYAPAIEGLAADWAESMDALAPALADLARGR